MAHVSTIFGTILTMLLSMPVIHTVLFGPRGLGEATFYYWLFGVPTLAVVVPLVGYPLLALLSACNLHGFWAVLTGTLLCALIGGLIISRAHGIIWQVIVISAVFGGIGGFTWTPLAQRGLQA